MRKKTMSLLLGVLSLGLLFTANKCKSPDENQHHPGMKEDSTIHKHTNALIRETSPYLLQHAHNPVNWYPWGEEALNKAKEENKLLLISIGYSACHWCHVMEKESFENEEIAAIMNEKFVCIKVDREERPDIDQVYMDAVQLLSQRGGWPLNCFALPDGRPFYGGTYFPPNQWKQILDKVHAEYSGDKEKVIEFADRLTNGVASSDIIELNTQKPFFNKETLELTLNEWEKRFDDTDGGANRAPKFPLPNNYQFLLRYGVLSNNKTLLSHVELTLDKMALGGIYDQLGGGFARYSTDVIWKVPHFEKMLYDNAQLISLYAEAYQQFKKPLYKEVVYETIEFVSRELMAEKGIFYSALDADSEGEEGKFYLWNKEELQALLKEDYPLFESYYRIGKEADWEHGNNILLRNEMDEAFASSNQLNLEDWTAKLANMQEVLMKERDKRIRPGLDDKSLTSWNALMLKGLTDAYQVFGEKTFLDLAQKNATFLIQTQRKEDGGLWHSYKEGESKINGYLEDYSFTIEGLIGLYEATFDQKWLEEAKTLTEYTIKHFRNEENGMFYFTSDLDEKLVARKTELHDNVTPASNSSIAKSLFYLGHYFDNNVYLEMSTTMLNNVQNLMSKYGSGYSNWGISLLHHTFPFYEIAIVGEDANKTRQQFARKYIPNKVFIGSTNDANLPLLEHKYVPKETLIYVCLNKSCQLPTPDITTALKLVD